jgi:hypothetical protein
VDDPDRGPTRDPPRALAVDPAPATKALPFLPETSQPIGVTPSRPFFFYENVLGKSTGYPGNWEVMERELFGIGREEIDSATVSACHRQRGYITNIPKERRVLHLSKYMSIGDLFRNVQFWPEWDRRTASGKLLTVRSKYAHPNFCNKVRSAVEKDGGNILDADLKKEVRAPSSLSSRH